MSITRSQVALNAIQWINLKPGPGGERAWLYADPAWRSEQLAGAPPDPERRVRRRHDGSARHADAAGVPRMLGEAGLRARRPATSRSRRPRPTGLSLRRGSPEWVRWFDPVRRRAEESNYLGPDDACSSRRRWTSAAPRVVQAAATGAFFDQDLLDRQVEYLAQAAEVLQGGRHPAGAAQPRRVPHRARVRDRVRAAADRRLASSARRSTSATSSGPAYPVPHFSRGTEIASSTSTSRTWTSTSPPRAGTGPPRITRSRTSDSSSSRVWATSTSRTS